MRRFINRALNTKYKTMENENENENVENMKCKMRTAKWARTFARNAKTHFNENDLTDHCVIALEK